MTIRLNAAVGKYIASYLFLTLLLLPISLYAECQVTLTWDPNTPTPAGYRLYQRESGESYNYDIFTETGRSTNYPVSGLSDNTTYHFVVRAYVGSEESGDSNEATYTCGSTGGSTGGGSNPPEQPMGSTPPHQPMAISPSDQMVDVSLQPTLTTSTFIDHDAGDYHTQTRWTIYRLDDDACVFDTTSTSALTSLTVPGSTLSPFTSYYWTVCYYDQDGNESTPSPTCDFTTQQASSTGQPNDDPTNDPPASLSSGGSSGSSGGSSGMGCFIQTLFGDR